MNRTEKIDEIMQHSISSYKKDKGTTDPKQESTGALTLGPTTVPDTAEKESTGSGTVTETPTEISDTTKKKSTEAVTQRMTTILVVAESKSTTTMMEKPTSTADTTELPGEVHTFQVQTVKIHVLLTV